MERFVSTHCGDIEHQHDALCDPTLTEPRATLDPDPVRTGHAKFMREHKFAEWLDWQLSRPLDKSVKRNKKQRAGRS